jgi:hypothetical protein
MLQRLAIAGLDDERVGQFRSRGFTVLRGVFDGTSAGDHADHYYADKHKGFGRTSIASRARQCSVSSAARSKLRPFFQGQGLALLSRHGRNLSLTQDGQKKWYTQNALWTTKCSEQFPPA